MAQEELGLICDRPMESYSKEQLFAIGAGLAALTSDVTLFHIMWLALLGVAVISWKQP